MNGEVNSDKIRKSAETSGKADHHLRAVQLKFPDRQTTKSMAHLCLEHPVAHRDRTFVEAFKRNRGIFAVKG
ncbi:MAG: hypothetical protein NTZ22_10740, partial [Hyphomicrobiales bacterium]|nr:hypothetical protein [Hyphomicrobiales bacterium]